MHSARHRFGVDANRLYAFGLAALVALSTGARLQAQAAGTLAERIQRIMDRPEFRRALFGIEFYSLESSQTIYALNAEKLFVPGSTTKLLTEGTALELLGADYHFHTRVYRTGTVDNSGTLAGDLVLVASGDPDLSGRVRTDGTLAFENEDHAYDGDEHTRAAHRGRCDGARRGVADDAHVCILERRGDRRLAAHNGGGEQKRDSGFHMRVA